MEGRPAGSTPRRTELPGRHGTAAGGACSALGGLRDQRKEAELDEGTISRLPGLRTLLVDGD